MSADPFSTSERRLVDESLRSGVVDAIWARDLPVVPTGDVDSGSGEDPFAYLARVAEVATPRTTLGTASVILGARHPLVIARAAVGLQQRTGRRFVLGIGSGGKPAMNEALGVSDRSTDVFRHRWCTVRSALRGHVGVGVSFALPSDWAPPPMFLASARRSHWEAIEGEADGWMAFASDRAQLETDLAMISSVCGGAPPLALRLDLHLLPDDDAPATLPTPVRGRVACSRRQLHDLVGQWTDLPLAHLMVRLTGPTPWADLHAVTEAWMHSTGERDDELPGGSSTP